MGCNIHNHIEYLRDIFTGYDENRKPQYKPTWVCGDYFKVNPTYKEDNEWGDEPLELVGFCDNRNYGLFAILADVRNYGGNKPIVVPKGLPDDLTKEVKKDAERWGGDAHSHSYFTLKELLDYQKNNPWVTISGLITPKAAKEFDKSGKEPTEWCQWSINEQLVKRKWYSHNIALDNLIEALKKRADELYVIDYGLWENEPEEAYKQSDQIRLVFWFDN